MKIIEIYTTTYCPYCDYAKDLLKKKGLAYHEIDVTDDQEERMKMVERAQGKRTVPQIFIRNKSIGGYTDLQALEQSGELDKLVSDDDISDN